MRFAYQNRGSALLHWNGRSAPYQSRAGETRSLGAYYPTHRNSTALRRYGTRAWDRNWNRGTGGSALSYEHDRPLGAYDVPLPGAPEVVGGYEAPQPGAAIVHLGDYVTTGDDAPKAPADQHGEDDVIDMIMGASSLTRVVAGALSAWHGVKRHRGSALWGAVWFAGGYAFPLLTPVLSLAQGYGKAK